MPQKELILKLQLLKQVKPDKDWTVFAKSQIFNNPQKSVSPALNNDFQAKTSYLSFIYSIFQNPIQKRVALSFATLVFLLAGFGLLGVPKEKNQDENLSQDNQNVLVASNSQLETFKMKSQNLIDIAKRHPEEFAAAVMEVRAAAEELTQVIKEKPELAKEVALNVLSTKTLLSLVVGEGEEEFENAQDKIYQVLSAQIIKDIKEESLTEENLKVFIEAKTLDQEGKYFESLEKLLSINFQQEKNNLPKTKEAEEPINSEKVSPVESGAGDLSEGEEKIDFSEKSNQ